MYKKQAVIPGAARERVARRLLRKYSRNNVLENAHDVGGHVLRGTT